MSLQSERSENATGLLPWWRSKKFLPSNVCHLGPPRRTLLPRMVRWSMETGGLPFTVNLMFFMCTFIDISTPWSPGGPGLPHWSETHGHWRIHGNELYAYQGFHHVLKYQIIDHMYTQLTYTYIYIYIFQKCSQELCTPLYKWTSMDIYVPAQI